MKGQKRVEAALAAAGLSIQVVQLAESARTAELAAAALGAPLGSIVKSLVFLADGKPLLVLVAGDRRASPEKLKGLSGARRVMIADADRVRQETGFSVGSVPPVGHKQPLSTWVDDSLARFEAVYAAAGHHRAVFPGAFQTLVRITEGSVADLAEPIRRNAERSPRDRRGG